LALFSDIAFCLKPRCPVCRKGRLFRPWSVSAVEACASCGEKLGQNDVGDGASVFLIFLLGFTLVPLALLLEHAVSPPLWVHVAVWGFVGFALIALILPAVKAYIILIEYRHRK
jgi:uncharacterized protein (DUF983 family)